MKLKVLDQVHISAVRADCLRPGEDIEVSDAMGADPLARLPRHLCEAGSAKADSAPDNKAEDPPPNKSKPSRSTK